MDTGKSMGMEREVTVCGELASDPDAARAMAEIGITSLSIAPNAAPMVREAIESAPRSLGSGQLTAPRRAAGRAQALQDDKVPLSVARGSERRSADR